MEISPGRMVNKLGIRIANRFRQEYIWVLVCRNRRGPYCDLLDHAKEASNKSIRLHFVLHPSCAGIHCRYDFCGGEFSSFSNFVWWFCDTVTYSCQVAYRRLRHGISSTIIHRMKALVINGINVLVYMAYWGLLLFLLSLAFLLASPSSEKWAERVLLFLISAKGASAVVVWILTTEVQFEPQRGNEDERVDLNGALRQELLYFATTGIRTCASKSLTLKRDQRQLVLYLQHKEERSGVELSPWFFLFLIFGREKEKAKIAALASAAHEITRLSPIEMEIRDNSIISNADDRKSQVDTIRMSQRFAVLRQLNTTK